MNKELRKELRRLMEMADAACYMAQQEKERFQNEAINWGDLKCVDAEYAINLDGEETYRVFIDEASHAATDFRGFVESYLKARGISNAEVITEW